MSKYKLISDVELSHLLSQGDEFAFEEIYNRYKTVLFLHARRLLNQEGEAKDVIQEIFITLWNKRDATTYTISLKSYLYTAVRNKIFNILAHRKFEVSYLNSLQNLIETGESNTDHLVREKQLIALIEHEIDLLPEKMKMVFELSRKEHLSHREIAEQLNISDKTVKKQINNAIKILRLKINLVLLAFPLF